MPFLSSLQAASEDPTDKEDVASSDDSDNSKTQAKDSVGVGNGTGQWIRWVTVPRGPREGEGNGTRHYGE